MFWVDEVLEFNWKENFEVRSKGQDIFQERCQKFLKIFFVELVFFFSENKFSLLLNIHESKILINAADLMHEYDRKFVTQSENFYSSWLIKKTLKFHSNSFQFMKNFPQKFLVLKNSKCTQSWLN